MINLVMDFALLWCVGHLGKFQFTIRRLLLGALCGGLYAVIIFLPFGQYIAGLAGKIVCSVLMVLLGYRLKSLKGFVKAMVYLYGVAFAMGGAVIAAMYVFGERFIQTWNGIAMVMIDFKILWLAFALLAAIILVCFLKQPIQHDLQQPAHFVQVKFALEGKSVNVKALVDTGNGLVEPISKKPVILVEFQTVADLMPEGVAEIYQKQPHPAIDQLLLAAEESFLAFRVRIIPYHAIGLENGVLLGFKPDWLVIDDKGKVYDTDAVIAIQNQVLSPYGTYQGLAHPDLLYA